MEDGEIVYRLRDGWRESRYLQGNYVFGYAGGSTWYWDRFCIAFALGQLAIIVCLCPLFVEDYACRTADVILSTPKGRFTVWKTRMAVGGLLASVYYWMCCGSIFFQYIAFYGADGLAACIVYVRMGIYVGTGCSCGSRFRLRQTAVLCIGTVAAALCRTSGGGKNCPGHIAHGKSQQHAASGVLQHAVVLSGDIC